MDGDQISNCLDCSELWLMTAAEVDWWTAEIAKDARLKMPKRCRRCRAARAAATPRQHPRAVTGIAWYEMHLERRAKF